MKNLINQNKDFFYKKFLSHLNKPITLTSINTTPKKMPARESDKKEMRNNKNEKKIIKTSQQTNRLRILNPREKNEMIDDK